MAEYFHLFINSFLLKRPSGLLITSYTELGTTMPRVVEEVAQEVVLHVRFGLIFT